MDERPTVPPRPRVPRLLIGVGIAALVFAGASAVVAISYAHSTGTPTTTKQALGAISASAGAAPGFARVSRSAPSFRIAALTGGKAIGPVGRGPVVVNFWASSCGPCRAEMPMLAASARALTGRVTVIGVDTADPRAAAVAFARAHDARYPIGYDPEAALANRFGVEGLPTTYFLSRDHREILGVYFGAMTRAGLAAALRSLYGVTLG